MLFRACWGALLPLSAFLAAAPTWAQPKLRFDLPADEFPRAILEFYRQSHVQVVFSSVKDLHSIRTQSVVGEFEPEEALKRMLKGTPLTFTIDARGAVIIKLPPAPSSSPGRVPSSPTEPPPAQLQPLTLQGPSLAAPANARLDEVLVTGSLIHGAMDVSAPLTSLTSQEISQASFPTVEDALYQLPINSLSAPREDLGLNSNYNWGTAINLRGLGVGATLVLVDGYRQPLSGYNGDFVDVSNIPASMVERIEVLPDGASALYGSDAIAGVVNVILRKDLVGAETQAYFGGAPGGRDEVMVSQLLGWRWNSGKAVLGYQYLDATPLAAAARAYAADADKTPYGGGDYRSIFSSPGNLLDPRTSQPLLPHPLLQNQFAQSQLFPELRQHNIYLTASQGVSESVELFVDGRFSQRYSLTQMLPYQQMLIVPSTNPFYVNPFGGSGPTLVAYSFLSMLGPGKFSGETHDYTGNAGASIQLPALWRVRLTESLGREQLGEVTYNQADPLALGKALADPNPATAFNPFGINSPATIAAIRASALSRATSIVATSSLIADGPLLAAPGGPVRLAVGIERREETLQHEGASPEMAISQRYSRNIDAAFSELSVPLQGSPDDPHLAPRLELTAAGRYERYSDFGHTFDPTTRLVWSPERWLKLRGSWGRSFRAPTLDNLHDTAQNVAGLALLRDPLSASGQSLVLVQQGDNPGLKQETATTWTAGIDLMPVGLPGSDLSLTYYAIEYRDQITTPAANEPQDILINASEWSSVISRNPTAQQVGAVCQTAAVFIGSRSICQASSPAASIDLRLANLSSTKVSGLDLAAHQALETPIGELGFGLNGTYVFYFDQATTSTAQAQDVLNTVGNPLALRLRASLEWSQRGMRRPGFGASLALSYTGGYRDPGSALIPNVDPFSTVDLQISYRAPADGWLSHAELTLNAVNLLNQNPPFVDSPYGYDRLNTQPLGRVVGLRVKKSW
jgi:outer membrane receptor protein involved in Fe transport